MVRAVRLAPAPGLHPERYVVPILDPEGAAMKAQPLFGTRVEGHDGVAVVALSGELDMAAAPILRENLARVEASGATTIMLDLREVTFIDSTGLMEFLKARSRAKDNGHRLLMSGASPAAQRLFELTETRFLLDEQGTPVIDS